MIGNHPGEQHGAGGHVHVDDWAILSGYTLMHQYCGSALRFSGMGSAIGKTSGLRDGLRQPGPPYELEGMRRRL